MVEATNSTPFAEPVVGKCCMPLLLRTALITSWNKSVTVHKNQNFVMIETEKRDHAP